MRFLTFCLLCLLGFPVFTFAQNGYWQQRAEYKMDVELNVKSNQFTGKQELKYFNNSPDTLTQVFYHLYFNAFQPNSMMDIRSRTIVDPDGRVGSRIEALGPDEIGYQKINSLKQDGKDLKYKVVGTILEVELAQPLLPGSNAVFSMDFKGQVPKQIRRSGRDNKEGIEFSMTQWYPKMSEYDYRGWHANPYIGREFHGVWGDFEVNITLDEKYIIGGTGVLQNPNDIGHGYSDKKGKAKDGKLTWKFKAEKVHDFAWAADPDFKHVIKQVPNGPKLHFFYQVGAQTAAWETLPDYVSKAFVYLNENFGKYPWTDYSVVQGGDGGMEYPMATLITGHRGTSSLVGVTCHEMIHSWYQSALATDESLYSWMDEGFTNYATNRVEWFLFQNGEVGNPHAGDYIGYIDLANSGLEEGQDTHSDWFNTNRAYGRASYSKGAVFLHQLSYIIGQKNLDESLRRYYYTWRFKHPTPNDFIRIAEKVSGMELDWYLLEWTQTTHTIDYGIKNVVTKGDSTYITLERIGQMPMPIELEIRSKSGPTEVYYLPLRIMRGEKANENLSRKWNVMEDWPWTHPSYTVVIPGGVERIYSLVIGSSERMADVDYSNNELILGEVKGGPGK